MTEDILSGGVAVITGAASGIGNGIARAAAARGMKLVLADIAAEALQDFAAELTAAGTETLAVPTDVTDPEAIDALAAKTHAHFGDIRLLINNAGIEMLGLAWELSAAQWERIVRINILGPIHGTRAFAGAMVKSGKPGFIANVSSLGGLAMMPEQTPYILSKHATLSFTECLFLEMSRAAPQIRVSAILPGPVATRIFMDAPTGPTQNANRHRAIMENMLTAHGMTPLAAGETILEQIAEGKFWVTTHPDMLAHSAQARATHLATLADPYLQPEALALLDPG
jgi:NAD(P)-dependent dehydrogenase (short-subunit alcohol dehydrogenase family)